MARDWPEKTAADRIASATKKFERTAHLPARRAMTQRWADYLDKLRIGADVIPFKAVD